MYKRVRFKLTCLFTGISGLILAVMSLLFEYISERELNGSQYLSFCNEAGMIISHLEQQNTISYEWLVKSTSDSRYTIAIYDGDVPLNYTSAVLSPDKQLLAEEILKNCASDHVRGFGSEFISPHTEMRYTASDGRDYYVSTANLHSGKIHVVIYRSLETLLAQINSQRIRLILINISGFFLLFLFSYFYTGKLLAPIREAQKKQTDFIAAVSHELRTPLAVILSSISAARKVGEKERETLCTTIEKEGGRMSDLLGDMLTLADFDNHVWSFHMEPTELDTLLLDTYETFLPLASEKHVNLEISLPEAPLPRCTCDKGRIAQLLGILISNALSYGGNRILLTLTYRASHFFLTVSDNGPGIGQAQAAHIFDRFYRGENSRSTKEHFGLGLSIAKEIVSAHHGTIALSKTNGGGCTFTVKL